MNDAAGTFIQAPATAVSERTLPLAAPALPAAPPGTRACSDEPRLRELFDRHFEFVWRSLRRLGVAPLHVDDATQEVFLVASRRVADIRRESERSFLFATALRVASDARRRASRRHLVGEEALAHTGDPSPGPDELVDQHRQRELLDRVLADLELDLRAVFVLYELEEMTMAEIAQTLALPAGTVASRLRRAREEFRATAARLRRST
jgi:RNA polymerase sigma-70 factor (ECF subfamily)